MSFELPSSPESAPESISSRIAKAVEEAKSLDNDTYVAQEHQFDEATRAYLNGEIDQATFQERTAGCLLDSGYVEATTDEEFTQVLTELGVPADEVSSIVAHEKAHFDVDEKRGLHPVYRLQLTTDRIGTLHRQPMVWSPSDLSEDDERAHLQENLAGPSDPSASDRRKLAE